MGKYTKKNDVDPNNVENGARSSARAIVFYKNIAMVIKNQILLYEAPMSKSNLLNF